MVSAMTAREIAGTFSLCAAIAAVIVALVIGSPQTVQQPAPVFVPTAFCPSGQHVVKISSDGMPVCTAPVKQSPFDFNPRRSS